MTSLEIRQSFLDFFKSKGHTIVPSASLMPDSPNLLFTNAGMNQFVPIFLGQRTADVSKWAGAIAGSDTRAADTQKCIRAGGKHNDLEDVGLDTYHHTFFEMLGNWSFGDYFKKEAITWAWELITEVWKVPKNRLYATVYSPNKAQGDPSDYDQEAADIWAELFRSAGLDPKVHIVPGNKKDNFWMMGDTGPCGPCSEIHVDLTPQGDTRGKLVNAGSAECIEIWNLVFIQFNANPDGSFWPLPAKHVDTGMGFERLTSFIQCTRGFTDFSRPVSNYETDIFRPIFDRLEHLSGKRYGSTLPTGDLSSLTAQQSTDIAFRVIADHLRTLSFAIADGILPGNTDRNYVLRRILRRAVRYGRSLGFREPFFYKLVNVLAQNMGHVFPEIRARQEQVEEVIHREEEAFNRTLDRGIELFQEEAERLKSGELRGDFVFKLYDTYGFPRDLTELMARERGLSVDVAGFERLMEGQKNRARAAQKKEIIELSQIETAASTAFIGYDKLETKAKVLEVVGVKDKTAVILDSSPFYAEMGGQVGDTGSLAMGSKLYRVSNTQKTGNAWLHFIDVSSAAAELDLPEPGSEAVLSVDRPRRDAIQRHHTVTHLLHWALHQVVSTDAVQKGSFVGPEKLTFDFSSAALSPEQVADIERLVNERIVENVPVTWVEVNYNQVKDRKDVMQFFGDKYGERVRVVQVGGRPGSLDGYSMELCGGTHVTATGQIGLFRISGESAVAAGIRRIEATAGMEAYRTAVEQQRLIRNVSQKLNSPVAELEKRIESLLAHQKEMDKRLRGMRHQQATEAARALKTKAQSLGSAEAVIQNLGAADPDELQMLVDALKTQFTGVIVLGGAAEGAVTLVASVPATLTDKVQAGKVIQAIAPIVGGKGGGRPDNARGGGKDAARLDEALARARELIQAACAA